MALFVAFFFVQIVAEVKSVAEGKDPSEVQQQAEKGGGCSVQ